MSVTKYQKGYMPIAGTKLVFDTNIWLALCWPMYNSSTNQIKKDMDTAAVAFLKSCINSKYKVLLPAIIVSEIINRIYRVELAKYQKQHSGTSLKEFRTTLEGKETTRDILQVIVSQICQFQRKGYIENIDDGFESFCLINAIKEIPNLDFNDSIIADICEKNSAWLVTNDSDFKAVQDKINIITTKPGGL